MKGYLGIDIGKFGAWGVIDKEGNPLAGDVFKGFRAFKQSMKEKFGEDISDIFGVVEAQTAMPRQGVCAMFTFGMNYGGWLATMELLGIPHELARPQKWQKAILGMFPKGMSKPRALQYAQKRWPHMDFQKKDDGLVDAFCIAQYARQLHLAGNGNITSTTATTDFSDIDII